jgi:hypothetical protein
LFKLNFNHSFNQTYINIKPTSTKNVFYKTIFFKPQPQMLPDTPANAFVPMGYTQTPDLVYIVFIFLKDTSSSL